MNKNIRITFYFPDEFSENPDKLMINIYKENKHVNNTVENFLEERDQKVLKAFLYKIIKKIDGE